MLIRRIVVDTARRLSGLYAIAVGVLFFLAWISNLPLQRSEILHTFDHLFAWSMAAAWFLASSPVMLLEAREIARLPISRREIWIARWWLAVVVPVVPIAIGCFAGALMGHVSAGPERFLLAIVYCLLYGGCYAAVSAAILPSTTVPGPWAVVRILIRMIVVPLGGAFLPLWFAKYLPRTFHDLSGPAMGALIAAAGVTIASYFYQPPIAERPGRARVGSSKTPTASRASVLDGLTGLTLLVFKEARKALVVYTCMLAIGLASWSIFGSASLADFFRDGMALIFSGLPESPTTNFAAVAILLMAAASDIGLLGDMRNLRTLPLSAIGLSTILTGTTVMTTTILWIVLVCAHVLALHALPSSLRPDLFLVVLGGLVLAQSMRLVWPAAGASKAAAGALAMLPMLIVFRLGFAPGAPWVRAAMMFGGGAALILSCLINVRTLRRGTRIYKTKPTPLQAISS